MDTLYIQKQPLKQVFRLLMIKFSYVMIILTVIQSAIEIFQLFNFLSNYLFKIFYIFIIWMIMKFLIISITRNL